MQLRKTLPIIITGLTLLILAPAAGAQTIDRAATSGTSTQDQPASAPDQPEAAQPKRKWRLQIGPEASLYLPAAAKTQKEFGKQWLMISFGIGKLDAPPSKGELSLSLQAGYQKKGKNEVTLAPVEVEFRQPLANGHDSDPNGPKPYIGAGGGITLTSMKVPSAGIASRIRSAPGGSVFLGVQWNRQAYIEARYHRMGSIRGYDFSGFDLSAGMRF